MDIAYHRLAMSQTRSLAGAQVLVAKLRNDVDLKQLRDAQNQPDGQESPDAAFAAIAEAAEPLAVSQDARHPIDKLA